MMLQDRCIAFKMPRILIYLSKLSLLLNSSFRRAESARNGGIATARSGARPLAGAAGQRARRPASRSGRPAVGGAVAVASSNSAPATPIRTIV